VTGDGVTVQGFKELDKKVSGLGRLLNSDGMRAVTGSVALDGKKDVEKVVSGHLGADRKMSNWGRFKFNSRYDLTSDTTAELYPSPAGPWQVLNFGRRGGHKLPKRKRLAYKRYRTPYGIRTASRSKPWVGSSSKGKGTWSIAVGHIADNTPERVHKHIRRILRTYF